MSFRNLAVFVLCSSLLLVAVFGDALVGRSLVAPLDLAPALFSKYRYVDPASDGVPKNHYIIDQLTYDLPLQHLIHESLRRGEIPWWNPYTYGGRPLLADAHVNGTDPIRLLAYATLPFELAYNWTRILHSLLTGLGMFCLLRWLRLRLSISIALALTYQFSGCQAMFFGHPWVQASFVYYPFLWIAWMAEGGNRTWRLTAASSLLCGLIFYAGNLQSSTYVVLFAGTLLAAATTLRDGQWWPRLGRIAISGIAGACLAAPVLLSQLELYHLGARGISSASPLLWLGGIFSTVAVFPWATGTFRTLDLGKFIGVTGLGFYLFIGSAALLVAVYEVFQRSTPLEPARRLSRRTALALVMVYFLICSTPLIDIFYHRVAPLAVIGLVVLAGLGFERLRRPAPGSQRWGVATGLIAVTALISVNVAAFLIYPRLKDRVTAMMAGRKSSSLDEAPALRRFQVENLPHEISVQNPETVFAGLSLLLLAGTFLTQRQQRRDQLLAVLLLVNLIPSVLFCRRFIPSQPIAMWHRLLKGGPEQQRVTDIVGQGRLWDQPFPSEMAMHEQLFPNEFANLYKIHTVHGYAALQPKSLFLLLGREPDSVAPANVADFRYESRQRGDSAGALAILNPAGTARIHWTDNRPNPSLRIDRETMNSLELTLAPGPAGTLLRTDTFYPGWQVVIDRQPTSLLFQDPCFSAAEVQAQAREIRYTFRPRFLATGVALATGGAILIGILALLPLRRRPKDSGGSSH